MDPSYDQRNNTYSNMAFDNSLRAPKKDSAQVNSWEMGNYDAPYSGVQATYTPSPQYNGNQEPYTSGTPPSPTRPVSFFQKLGRFESETWLVEILSMAASLSAAALIIIYLRRYDGKPYPDLPKSITLNALLSVGVTIMVATLGIPISSGLGQLNWIRAKQSPIPLSKMATMDKGSRGAWGSLLVIFGWAGGPIGAIGALAFIPALTAAPLAQQAIFIVTEQVLSTSDQPSIARCNGSTGFAPANAIFADDKGEVFSQRTASSSSNRLPSAMKGEYYSSIYNNFDPTAFSDAFATCATGNCTWDPFVTLSLCTQCKNVTDLLVPSKFDGGSSEAKQFSLPGTTDAVLDPLVTYRISDTNSSERVHSSRLTALRFAAAEFVRLDNVTSKSRPETVECAMSFCVQVIDASVQNGLLNENVLEKYDFDDSTIKGKVRTMTISPPVPATQNTSFTESISADLSDTQWIRGLATFIGDSIGSGSNTKDDTIMLNQRGLANLTATMDNMAMAMGRAFRSECAGGQMRVAGSTLAPVIMVRIRWYWLIVPFIIEALGLLFFFIVVVLNLGSGASLWKTNFLAPALHGLKLENTPQPMRLEKVHEMDAVASVKVQLQDDRSGGGARSRLRY